MRRENLKANICGLCFNTKFDVHFKVVEVIKEVLEIVLPKLNLEEGDKDLICSSCSVKLFAAFNFKSVCTDTEDTIFPYVTSQEVPLVDLREIYLKEKRDIQLIDILENQKICRLCFQSIRHGFVSLNEVDADIIDDYIPEVNFNSTKDPVICKLCSDSLVTHGTFLSSCLAAQEENRKVCGDPAEDRQCCIKTEEIKIEDDWESNPPPRLANVETIENSKLGRISKKKPVKNKKHPPQKVQTYTCNTCDFKTMYKCSLRIHCLNHISLTTTYISPKSQCKNESRDASSPSPLRRQQRVYQCEKCLYRTHLRKAFASHLSTHEVPSAVRVYHCEKCHYRTTGMGYFRRHQLRHENGGNVQNYTCDNCGFQTRYKNHLLKHVHLHKKEKREDEISYTTSEGELTYKCNVCKYETKYKSRFSVHRCPYANPSKQLKFKCRMCQYVGFDQDNWMKHQSKHSSGEKTFKCDVCSYQTIWKNNYVRHQLSHKNFSEVKTYDCCKCSYRTKYKGHLKRHELLHSTLE